jgi:biopolymer transport protein ExbD
MKRYHTARNLVGAISDINTTPLVDVMLVLLIIFMISAPMPQNVSKARIPLVGPKTGELLKPPTLITLDIAPAGNGALLFLDGVPTTLSGLPALILAANSLPKPPELNLRTDPNTSYEAVARVLAVIQRSGAKNVRFDELTKR